MIHGLRTLDRGETKRKNPLDGCVINRASYRSYEFVCPLTVNCNLFLALMINPSSGPPQNHNPNPGPRNHNPSPGPYHGPNPKPYTHNPGHDPYSHSPSHNTTDHNPSPDHRNFNRSPDPYHKSSPKP